MKFQILILLIFLIPFNSSSQSMAEVFRLLPVEYSLDLDLKQRDTLLNQGEYIFPVGDSLEAIVYEIDTNELSSYLRFGFRFTTGQNGFASIEIRKFKRNNGSVLIVYSRVGGMLRAYDQQKSFVFDYKKGKLVLNNEKLLPENMPIKDFLKKGTPDSIAKMIQGYVMTTYDLHPENPQSVSYNLFPAVPLDDFESYILSYSMIFTWNGKTFTKKLKLEKEE